MLVERKSWSEQRSGVSTKSSACDAVGEARHAGGADWGRPAEAGSSDRTGGAEHAHKSSKTGYSSSKIVRSSKTACNSRRTGLKSNKAACRSRNVKQNKRLWRSATAVGIAGGGAGRAGHGGKRPARWSWRRIASCWPRSECCSTSAALSLQRQQDELNARALELETKAADLDTLRDDLNAQKWRSCGKQPSGMKRHPTRAASRQRPRAWNPPVGAAKGAGPQSVVVTSAWQSPESLQDESGDSVVDHSRCRWRGARTTQTKRRM